MKKEEDLFHDIGASNDTLNTTKGTPFIMKRRSNWNPNQPVHCIKPVSLYPTLYVVLTRFRKFFVTFKPVTRPGRKGTDSRHKGLSRTGKKDRRPCSPVSVLSTSDFVSTSTECQMYSILVLYLLSTFVYHEALIMSSIWHITSLLLNLWQEWSVPSLKSSLEVKDSKQRSL